VKGFKVLKGIESDILSDGSLDYPEKVLAGFDLVVASVHSGFQMSRERMTERVVKAVENPFTTVLGHPTGRLLLKRDPFAIDLHRVLEACGEHGVVVEINANPWRLDLDWREIRGAKEAGCRFSIGPDAHEVAGLDDVDYGLGIARKGWLEKADVVNSLTAAQLVKLARSRR
jgi:DNA polymerase (family 10)